MFSKLNFRHIANTYTQLHNPFSETTTEITLLTNIFQLFNLSNKLHPRFRIHFMFVLVGFQIKLKKKSLNHSSIQFHSLIQRCKNLCIRIQCSEFGDRKSQYFIFADGVYA